MLYNNKLAVAIKVDGKVLREHDKDKVFLPFGTEYSILIKNLNTVMASVDIFIDGTNVVGGSLVIDPGTEIELERSVTNGNLSAGNRFKFIERTETIEEHRGITLEDGLVKIQYQFEKPLYIPTSLKTDKYVPTVKPFDPLSPIWASYGSSGEQSIIASSATSTSTATLNSVLRGNDVGITVPGSVSNQKFVTAKSFQKESTVHTMILHLLGKSPDTDQIVQKPLTVDVKPKCTICGKVNKAGSKFCTECGTSLTII